MIRLVLWLTILYYYLKIHLVARKKLHYDKNFPFSWRRNDAHSPFIAARRLFYTSFHSHNSMICRMRWTEVKKYNRVYVMQPVVDAVMIAYHFALQVEGMNHYQPTRHSARINRSAAAEAVHAVEGDHSRKIYADESYCCVQSPSINGGSPQYSSAGSWDRDTSAGRKRPQQCAWMRQMQPTTTRPILLWRQSSEIL